MSASTKPDPNKKLPLYDENGFPILTKLSNYSRARLGLPAVRLTKSDGTSYAWPYWRLESFSHIPSLNDAGDSFELLCLLFAGWEVAIRGKNLSKLLMGLQMGMVFRIWETTKQEKPDDCWVAEIQIAERGSPAEEES